MEEVETDLSQYAHLRTILDSLEIGALRYYLNATSYAEQQEHFTYLDKELTGIIGKIWRNQKETDCPDGYYECDGVCVPYVCVH